MASLLYGEKMTKVLAGTLGDSGFGGNRFTAVDTYTVPAATVAAADTVFFAVKIPKGARMLGGVFKNTAGGAAATAKVNTYTLKGSTFTLAGDSHYGTLTDLTGATSQTFGDTDAKKYFEKATDDWWIGILTAAQAIQAAAVLTLEANFLL